MRGLFVADVHACNRLPHAKVDQETGVSDRLRDIVEVFKTMRQHCLRRGIFDIFILGDLFHTRLLDAITLKVTIDALREMAGDDITVWMLAGNHDASDAEAMHYTIDAFAMMGLDRIRLMEGPFKIGEISFLALSYKPEHVTREQLKLVEESGIDRSHVFLLMHQTVMGAQMGNWKSPDGLTLEELAPYAGVISGHYHTPQMFLPGKGLYLGAPIQHGFGDAGEDRGFWEIDFEDYEAQAAMHVTPIPVDAPKFFTFTGKFVEGALMVEQVLTAAFHPSGCYVQVTIEQPPQKDSSHDLAVAEWRKAMFLRGARDVKVRWVDARGPQKERMKIDVGEAGQISLVSAALGYVDQLDLGELSVEHLKQIGLDALRAAGEVS